MLEEILAPLGNVGWPAAAALAAAAILAAVLHRLGANRRRQAESDRHAALLQTARDETATALQGHDPGALLGALDSRRRLRQDPPR